MSINHLLVEYGEYVLLLLFSVLIVTLLMQVGLQRTRVMILIVIVLVFALASSVYWPMIRTAFVYLCLFFAMVGGLYGAYEIMGRSKKNIAALNITPIRVILLGLVALILILLEFAQDLLGPLVVSIIPLGWWNVGVWILPATGLAKAMVDPTRRVVRSLFPNGNTRAILFLFVLAAGLLVPTYLPAVDGWIKGAAVAGVLLGLFF